MLDGPKDTRSRILASAYDLFFREGFGRVSMDAIAASASLTKRTVYYHFESKDALAAAVLEQQNALALAYFQEWGSGPADTPEEFLTALFKQFEIWAAKPRWLGSGFTRLTMELADRPGHPVRQAAHTHKLAIESWLAGELRRLNARSPDELAKQSMLLIEGCLSLVLIHGDTSYISVAASTASRLAN